MSQSFEQEISQLIIDTLTLELSVSDINPDEPLFNGGLSLDSIDALEIAVAISGKYGVQIKSGDQNTQQIFSSVKSLAEHVQNNRTK